MSKQLPPRPNLEHLKKQAKDLLNAFQQSSAEAIQRIKEHHPQRSNSSGSDRLDANFSLQDAQFVIAREYGFDSWPKLVAAITSTQPERTPVICSFCGKSMKEVNKIIQGPSVHICNECVDTCGKILSGVSISDWTNPSEGECRFCKRDASLGIQVIVKQSTDTKICNDCVKLCVEVSEHLRQSRRLEKPGTAQSGWKQAPPKGGRYSSNKSS